MHSVVKLLVIEDDKKIAQFIANGFKEAGMVVDCVHDGMEGLDLALVHSYDALIVDIMLPNLDGLSIIEHMRAEGNHTPVMILSAKRSVSEKIEGLQKGGDDYMIKPFAFSELFVRIQTLVRRSNKSTLDSTTTQTQDSLQYADLTLNPWKHEAKRNGTSISLHPKEFTLLEHLIRNAERVISKTSILENVYDYSFDPQTNVVDVLVCRLRNKVDKGFEAKLIHTVRGMGYVLKKD